MVPVEDEDATSVACAVFLEAVPFTKQKFVAVGAGVYVWLLAASAELQIPPETLWTSNYVSAYLAGHRKPSEASLFSQP